MADDDYLYHEERAKEALRDANINENDPLYPQLFKSISNVINQVCIDLY